MVQRTRYLELSMQGETRFTLAPGTTLPRIWTGLWQLSSSAWGSAPAPKVRDAMASYTAKGYGAFGKYESSWCIISRHLPNIDRTLQTW